MGVHIAALMLVVARPTAMCHADSVCAVFFFSSRRRHTRCSRDWSSDVCSSDLFPITLTMNSPVVLKMDFNVDASVQPGDLSITPTVSLVQVPTTNSTGQQDEEDVEVVGTITSLVQTTFNVQSGMNGRSLTIPTADR